MSNGLNFSDLRGVDTPEVQKMYDELEKIAAREKQAQNALEKEYKIHVAQRKKENDEEKAYKQRRIRRDIWKPDVWQDLDDYLEGKQIYSKLLKEIKRHDDKFIFMLAVPEKVKYEEIVKFFTYVGDYQWHSFDESMDLNSISTVLGEKCFTDLPCEHFKIFQREVINKMPRSSFMKVFGSKHKQLRSILDRVRSSNPEVLETVKKGYIVSNLLGLVEPFGRRIDSVTEPKSMRGGAKRKTRKAKGKAKRKSKATRRRT